MLQLTESLKVLQKEVDGNKIIILKQQEIIDKFASSKCLDQHEEM